ncbi:hypothetical protein KEM48_007162 [Puccinia striiformis f. sp. tritici PST-130]|nr:hypothetical protein KEM48_007162 [Puccinia striiformis f. sp. tritici PST-130]
MGSVLQMVHFDQVADPIGNPSEGILMPDRITNCSDLKTYRRSPIGDSSQRPGILTKCRIHWRHERLKRRPVFRRGPGEGTRDSPIIVASADKEMRVAMAPEYPQGPEIARPASPPFIPYTAADRAVEDRFCALHGIQRPISPQYQPARFEEDIPVDPGFDRPLNPTRGFAENDVVETLVEPNAEGGFIQANQFRPMSFVDNPIDNQFRFQISIFFPSSGLQGFPRNGKNPQFKDTDRTEPGFSPSERRQEFVNNHQSGFFTGGIPGANEPNLNAGAAGPPPPETSNGGSTDTSWSTFIAGSIETSPLRSTVSELSTRCSSSKLRPYSTHKSSSIG